MKEESKKNNIINNKNRIKKRSIQKEMVIEFLIAIILVAIFSIIGFYVFVNQEASKIIEINLIGSENSKEILSIIRRSILIILLNSIIISTIIIKISSKKILKPMEKMIDATKKVASGDFDIRLETKRNDETVEFVNNFNYMVAELGKTELLQKDFIDNVSHEIKTPINSIQGFAKLLKEENITKDEKEEYISIIIEETNRLLKLSNNILKLAKLQHQDTITNKSKINLTEQIRKVLTLLEPKWRKKGLEISISYKNFFFEGNEELLFQVWTNIIDNAIKFTKEKGRIDIRLEEKDNNVEISIKDNGIGMQEEEIEKVFNKFYQVDVSHGGEGSGLGLSIVKKIVELSNGNIKIDSKLNEGTNVKVELPIAEKENTIVI